MKRSLHSISRRRVLSTRLVSSCHIASLPLASFRCRRPVRLLARRTATTTASTSESATISVHGKTYSIPTSDTLERFRQTATELLETEQVSSNEEWFTAENCLNQLRQGSDAASTDLFLRLYDKLLMTDRPRLDEGSSSISDFLINREMIHRAVFSWQQLHRVEEAIPNLLQPRRLLDYLHAWSRYIPGNPLISNTIMSWTIDAIYRRSKGLRTSDEQERTDDAQLATDLLSRMWDNPRDFVRPSATNVNVVICLWRHDPVKAMAVFRANSHAIDIRTYHHLLPALSAPAAETIVKEKLQVRPDITCWNLVLNAYAKSGKKLMAAERVQHIMVHIMTNPTLQPDVVTFNTALRAWARVGWANQCEKVMRDMKEAYEHGTLDKPPDAVTYATVINAFAKAGEPERAERLSNELYQTFMSDNQSDLKPNILTFTSILDAYSRSIAKAVDKKNHVRAWAHLASARRIWDRMWELYQFGLLLKPDVQAYNTYMSCYQRTAFIRTAPQVNTAAEQVEKLYQEVKNDPLLQPDFITFSITMQAWLQRADGIERAMELLDEAWNDEKVFIDACSMHHIVTGICRAGRPGLGQTLLLRCCEARRTHPHRLEEPIRPSFGAVLGGWTTQRGPIAAKKAHELMQELHRYREEGVLALRPDRRMYQALTSIWANSHTAGATYHSYAYLSKMRDLSKKEDPSMRPNLMNFHNVLLACGRGKVNPFMAEMVLQELRDDYENSGCHASLRPVAETFNLVLNAWARYDHPDSVRKAEELFSEVQRLHATGEFDCCDMVTYNIMLNCYANSGRREDAEKAERLLQGLERVAKPNARAHGAIIKAWSKAGVPEKAHETLLYLCKRYLNGEKEMMQPIQQNFDVVMKAWRNTEHVQAQQKMREAAEMRQSIMAELST